jgi:outer membrane autotransporter protein
MKAKIMFPSLALALAMMFLHQNASAQTEVELGTAGGFSVLAGSGISNTGPTTIIGNVGLSPTTGAAITGFPPALVTGTVYTVNAFGPAGSINNPGLLTIANNDLNTAYLDAAGRTPNVTFVPIYDLGGQTLVGGVYKAPSSLGITGTLTLNAGGNPDTVWIFQSGSTLITASNSRVILINGAQACMVFWQVGSSATLGTNSTLVGTVMALTSITALTGATVDGRLLALNGAVTLDSNTIAVPICAVIHPGETLGGTGFIPGNVTNTGIVSPGNAAPGTLVIGGNFTQLSNGTVVIGIASSTAYSQLAVVGSAILAGTLQIVSTGNYRPEVGDKVTILTAGNGVSGQFNNVINPYSKGPGSLVYQDVVYTDNTVILEAFQNTFENALSQTALTPNQTSVAGALDHAINDTRQRDVLDYLDGLNFNSIPGQLDRISPEELTSIFTLGFAQFDTEVFSVQQRLADIRATPASEEAPIFPRDGKSIVPMRGTMNARPMDGKSVARSEMPTEDQWGFFVTETGDFTSLGDTSNANGFDLKSYGTTVGVDRRLGEHFVLGLTLGYNHSDIDLSGDGRLNSDGAKVALYAMYHDGGFWTEGLIGGGINSYDSRRTALNGTAHGSTNGTQFDAYYGLGYDVKLGRFTVTPMASMLFTSVGIDSFDERGSLQPLHIESQTESSLRSRIGVRVAYTAEVGAARVTPSISAQWQHEFLDNELALDSRFANGAGDAFSVHGPKVGSDSALVTAALNVSWSRYSTYVAYQADLGRTNYESQTVLVGLRVSF